MACAVRLVLAFLQLRELAAVRAAGADRRAHRCREPAGALRRARRAASLREATPDRPQRGFALALIDLDHFKEVNDSFGHATGDELLQAVVDRFTAALDQLQTPHLFARLGGDEFAVILHEVDSYNAAMACGSALQESLRGADRAARRGAARAGQHRDRDGPDHAVNRGDMLFAADAAMYAAKTPASGSASTRRPPWATAASVSAWPRTSTPHSSGGELTVEYQPIVRPRAASSAPRRWCGGTTPTRGRLSPAEFLETAERYKLTPAIAERVLDVALTDLASLAGRRRRPDGSR